MRLTHCCRPHLGHLTRISLPQATESELKDWVTLMVHCCGDELQTEVKLAAAEILVHIAPHLLTNHLPVLGKSTMCDGGAVLCGETCCMTCIGMYSRLCRLLFSLLTKVIGVSFDRGLKSIYYM